MYKYLAILLALVTMTGCLESFPGDGEEQMAVGESTSGGWSKTVEMVAGDENSGATMQANFPESGEYTVQFSISNIVPSLIAVGVINPMADITWTVEGNPVRRTVSIANGTTVSGVGQACKVEVYDAPLRGGNGGVYTYNIGITLAPGSRAANQTQPTFIDDYGYFASVGSILLAPAVSQIIAVPVDAGATSVYITAKGTSAAGKPLVLTDADLLVEHINIVGAFVDKSYNPIRAGWVPLAPSTYGIQLTNEFAAGPGNNIVFSITFGIDG